LSKSDALDNTMETRSILVTGGAGYIGSVLTPKLLGRGHQVTVLDLMFFEDIALGAVAKHPNLKIVSGDIRSTSLMEQLFRAHNFEIVIHLAAISNDPCAELDPNLTREINQTAVSQLMHSAKNHNVKRFIYASSASVYGIKDSPNVTEDLLLEPITLYAKYKAEGENILNELVDEEFCGVSVRSATVAGYSPRLRLDLTINLLTCQALTEGEIRVFGGTQLRPNIHVKDLSDFYLSLIDAPTNKISGKAFNVSKNNGSVIQLAKMIRDEINPHLPIKVVPTDDRRSYHLSTDKVEAELGFKGL